MSSLSIAPRRDVRAGRDGSCGRRSGSSWPSWLPAGPHSLPTRRRTARWAGDVSRSISPSLKLIGDGLTNTDQILVGPKGTRGTIMYSLSNDGPRPARILPESSSDSYEIASLKWEPIFVNGVIGRGTIAQQRSFPVTMAAHAPIGLRITIVQPTCGRTAAGGL